MGIWAFLDACLLAAGILAVTFSLIWRMPDLVRDITISHGDLNAGLVLGITYLVTFIFSVAAVLQPNHVVRGLAILNVLLIAVGAMTVAIGSFVWFFTLRERANFYTIWQAVTPNTRVSLQNTFSCCGYFNNTDFVITDSGFCADTANFVNSTACVGPLTSAADYTLNNIFTSIYGFVSIIVLLFLMTACVINKRNEQERFRRIDEKRGGKGFV